MYLSFIDAYNNYLKYAEIKQKFQSVNVLKENFKNHILPYWENYNIYEITETDYFNWQYLLNSKGLSFNYKKKLHYLMSSFFNYCIMFFNLKKNVAKEVGCFNKNIDFKVNHNFYTYKEFHKFIKYVNNEVYKQFFIFMFFVGTRPGEAMALKFSDLNDNIIFINKTISEKIDKNTNHRYIGTPKTLSSYRKIHIDKKLYKDLIKLKNYYEKKYNNKNFDYYIFGGIKPLAPTSIRRYMKNASIKANVKYIKIHELRHSHASLLFKNKIPIMEISKRLGHCNVSTTLNTYTHIDVIEEKRVIKTLSNLRFFSLFRK